MLVPHMLAKPTESQGAQQKKSNKPFVAFYDRLFKDAPFLFQVRHHFEIHMKIGKKLKKNATWIMWQKCTCQSFFAGLVHQLEMTFGRQKNFVAFQNTLTQVSKPSLTFFSISVELRNIQRFFATKNSFLAKKKIPNPFITQFSKFRQVIKMQILKIPNPKKSTICFLEWRQH